jgi:hypothetical protein
VIGRYYDDQYINILNIWRALPQGVSLLVKEHSNAIGDRGLLFYRKISLLSDTYIIDEKEETYTLISNAEGVVTVSGTAAYESALMGIKSYTFAPTFFNNLEHCTKICLHTIKNTNIFSPALDNQKTSINDFSKWLNRRAFKGIISDPISNPNCVSEENLSLVSNAILEITQSQNS